MAKTLSKEQKSLREIAQEKSFLQGRWKELKKEDDKDEDVKNEKSYVKYRWKHLNQEEKALKSILNSKAVKDAPAPATESFAKKFQKSKKSIKAAHALLKSLSELPTADFKNNHRLEAYFHGRKMYEIIGKMFGDEDKEEDDEEKMEEKGMKTLSRLLLTTKNLDAYNDVDVTDEIGKLKGPKKDPMQQHTESAVPGGTRGSKDFPEMKNNGVNTESKPNPAKIAKIGEDDDVMPFYHGHDGEGSDHLIPGVGKKKEFDVIDHANSEMHLTKPGGNSCVHAETEPMQQWGDGGSLVKFFKRVADAGMFLKTLAYEKAFGDAHRAMAKSLADILAKDMSMPGIQEGEEQFPGDLHGLGKKALPDDPMMSMGEEEDPLHPGMNPMMDETGGGLGEENPMTVGGIGEENPLAEGGLGLGMEEEEETPFGMEEGMEELDNPLGMGKSGVKSLDIIRANALQQSQTINELHKSIQNLQSMLNN